MKLRMKHLFWVIAPCLLIFGAFALQQGPASQNENGEKNDSLPSRRQLRRNFFQKREVLVVYGAKEKLLTDKYRILLDSLSQAPEEDSRRNITIKFKEASLVSDSDIQTNILFLVGTAEGNQVLKRLVRKTPFEIGPNSIRFNGKDYIFDDAILSVGFYPNAENDTLPITFLTGNNETKIHASFENKVNQGNRYFFRQNMDYELYDNKTRTVLGDFDEQWQLDTSIFFDFSSGNDLAHSSKHYDFVTHQNAIDSDTISELADEIEKTTSSILDFLGKSDENPKYTYHIYKSAEEKGLMTGNTAQAHFESSDNSVHTVINEIYQDNFIEKENALLINQFLDAPKLSAFEHGLPVYFTNRWQRKGYHHWSAQLFASGNALTLSELFDNEIISIESPLIVDCMSASLVDFLLKTWGRQTFLKRYTNWLPSQQEIQHLEPLWQDYLSEKASIAALRDKKKTELPYLKGFNFAHEGYSIYNGYGSKKGTEAIEKQHEMGSNAIAIVPYSYIRDKNKPAPFHFSSSAGSENDESVVHSAYQAKQLGMYSLLKPQIFVGGSWPGDIEMSTANDWKKFFDYYYRWIRHYAFLAEIHKMDALCLGVEFTKATLGQGEAWRKMIQKTRGLFHGKITYAANWGQEFENIDFWNELDFIGLNCYYPLSKKDDPTDAEMRAKFDTIKTKIKTVYDRFNKPIVFTEIGFRSINMPWKNPHAEGDDSFNETHQQRCYEIVFEGIKNEPWCQGILWWKFPSYLEYRGRENSAFTPNNKKAEMTVRKWFTK